MVKRRWPLTALKLRRRAITVALVLRTKQLCMARLVCELNKFDCGFGPACCCDLWRRKMVFILFVGESRCVLSLQSEKREICEVPKQTHQSINNVSIMGFWLFVIWRKKVRIDSIFSVALQVQFNSVHNSLRATQKTFSFMPPFVDDDEQITSPTTMICGFRVDVCKLQVRRVWF